MSDVSRFEVRPEYETLAAELAAIVGGAIRRTGGRLVVGVAGESGSGKSATASSLGRRLAADGLASALLHQDDYFVLPPRANHENRCRALANVGPHEVRMQLLAEHLRAFVEGREAIDMPECDYANDRFVTRRMQLVGTCVLIVEGTYVLRLDGIDLRVFLEATHEDTRERRRARARDVDAPIIDEVLAIEHEIVAAQRAHADVVIDRQFRIVQRPADVP